MTEDPIAVQFKYNFPPTTVVPSTTVVIATEWQDAVAMLSSDVNITPYVAKCLYFIGTVRHIVDAASKLFKNKYNLPALLLACSVIELLGRCIRGDATHYKGDAERLKVGFRKIIEVCFPYKEKNNQKIFTSDTMSYSQKDLIALRNFGAHGFSGSDRQNLYIDRLFIGWLLGGIGETLDSYFEELKVSDSAAKNMARAGIDPLFVHGADGKRRPIHVEKIYNYLNENGQPGKFAFEDFWYEEYQQVIFKNNKNGTS